MRPSEKNHGLQFQQNRYLLLHISVPAPRSLVRAVLMPHTPNTVTTVGKADGAESSRFKSSELDRAVSTAKDPKELVTYCPYVASS